MSDEVIQSGSDTSGSDAADLAAMFSDEPDQPAAVETPDDEPEIELPDDVEPEEEPSEEGDDDVFEIKVNGKTQKLTRAEIVEKAQLAEGARVKFEEAAAIRKEAEALKTAMPEREKQLAQVLQHYIQQAQALMPQEPNWRQLLEQDPHNYQRVRLDWEQRIGELNQARQAEQVLKQRESEAQAAANHGRILEAKEKLLEAIPAWKDPIKAAEGAKQVDKYLESKGIPQEMRAAIDHPMVVVLAQKAMLYDQALERRQQVQTGQVQQPLKTERPGVSSQATPKAQVRRAQTEKAWKANPSIDTLANFFQ